MSLSMEPFYSLATINGHNHEEGVYSRISTSAFSLLIPPA